MPTSITCVTLYVVKGFIYHCNKLFAGPGKVKRELLIKEIKTCKCLRKMAQIMVVLHLIKIIYKTKVQLKVAHFLKLNLNKYMI